MKAIDNEGADSIEFLRFVYTRKKPILLTVLFALILVGIITALSPKKYSSSAIIFPVFNNNVESVIDNPVFGYDVEADRLLQLLESDEVRDSVVSKFKLVEYYGLDKTSPDWSDQLRQKFIHDVDFSRTQYMSIIITVETKKPELSSQIANYIIELADGVRNRIFKQNELAAFHSIEKEYFEKQIVVDTLKKEIAKLRGNSGTDLVALINMQGMVQTIGGSSQSQTSTELERKLNQYIYEQSRLNEIASRYEKAKAQCESPITKVYVVDRARPSYKKVSPSFLFNLGLAGALSLFFSITFLLFFERLRFISQPKDNA